MQQSTLIKGVTLAHIDFVQSRSVPSMQMVVKNHEDKSKSKICVGWFDTGATISVVSQKVCDYLQLKKTGIIAEGVVGYNGFPEQKELYNVVFQLNSFPENIIFEDSLQVIVSPGLNGNYDVLMGLDILQKCQFNYNGIEQTFTISFPK